MQNRVPVQMPRAPSTNCVRSVCVALTEGNDIIINVLPTIYQLKQREVALVETEKYLCDKILNFEDLVYIINRLTVKYITSFLPH